MDELHHYLRPPATHRNWLTLATLGLVITGVWLTLLAIDQYRIAERVRERNNKLAAIVSTSKVPTMGRVEQDNLKKWNQLKIERDYPWSIVFRVVEKTASTDIELLEFTPDKLNHTIALSGEAHNRKALVNYLAQLSQQTALTNVYLTHQQTVQRDTLETIGFEIRATLKE